MELKEEVLEKSVFKTEIYDGKSVDSFIKEAYDSIKSDDKKVSQIIDELMSIIDNKMREGEDGDWEAQISFLAPVLAELFKSSADFKKQRTDLINSIQKFISTEQKKKNEVVGGLSLADIWTDISKRNKDE